MFSKSLKSRTIKKGYLMHKLNIIKNPAGSFHFVGKVPAELALIGEPDDVAAVLHCGFVGDLSKRVKNRTFTTEDAARDAARSAGYEVQN